MSRKRILYIESNKDGTVGGSYYSMLYLLQGLDRSRYEPVVMFCLPNELIPEYEKISEVIVYDFDPSLYEPISSVREAARYMPKLFKHVILKQAPILRKLREIRPDAVHLNDGYNLNHEWILAARLSGIKAIAHDRGSRPPISLQSKLVSRMMDAIICVSDAFLENVRSAGLRPRIAVRVYNGLDTSSYESFRTPESRMRVRRELGIEEDEILVGTVGNIDYFKGQIVFVKALNRIIKANKRVKGIIVGKTAGYLAEDYEAEIRSYLAENGLEDSISLLGFRNDVPALLGAMDVFVHASIGPEAFGRVILEAKAMSRPVIATNGGGVPEQIEHGVTGLLVPMNDVDAMALAMENLVGDPAYAQQLGETAFRQLRDNFSIEQMVRGVENVYERVFAGDRDH